MIDVRVVWRQIAAADALDLVGHPSTKGQEVHPEVAAERPEGVIERGRPVLLEHEVTDPGRAVSDHGREEQRRGVERDSGREGSAQNRRRPEVMERAVSPITMSVDVVRPKLVERLDATPRRD